MRYFKLIFFKCLVLSGALFFCSTYALAEDDTQMIVGKLIASHVYDKFDTYYELGIFEEYSYTRLHKDNNGDIRLKLGTATKKYFFLSVQPGSETTDKKKTIVDNGEFWADYPYIFAAGYPTGLKHPSPDYNHVMLFDASVFTPLKLAHKTGSDIWLKQK